MFIQLMLIGYVLVYIFEGGMIYTVLIVLLVMISAAGWIALSVTEDHRKKLYFNGFASIFLGGSISLFTVTFFVLKLEPWYEAAYLIPLAGMIYANAMNSVSLAVERMNYEMEKGADEQSAGKTAFQTSLIPVINSLFAVGLVSLPGMMTGQILSGVSPLTASRYQIVVMCMVLGSAGMSSGLFILMSRRYFTEYFSNQH